MNRLQLPSITGLVWWVRRTAWYLGWIPMALSMLAGLTWLYLWQQQSDKQAHIAMLEQEVQHLTVQPASGAEVKPLSIEKTAIKEVEPVTLSDLWERLPATSELSPRMLEIAALAQKHQIPLNVGDYQWQAHQNATGPQQIQQFDMRFTIQADYATCRKFMIDVLQRYPTMALTGLELRKNDTLQPVVEATLTFSMFIRGGQTHAS